MENNQSDLKVTYKKSSRAMDALRRVPGGDKLAPPVQQEVQKAPPVQTANPVQKAVDAGTQVAEEPKQVEPPAVVDSVQQDFNPEEVKEPIPAELVPEEVTDDVDQAIDPKATIGQNFKNLRTKLKSINKQTKEYKAKVEELTKKVADYETGLVTPELIAAQTARLEELEKYEKIYNIKGSPAYRKNFLEPLQQEQEKLGKLAKDYNVDVGVLSAAYNATNTADMNRMLSQAFRDDVGALEAKSIFKAMRGIEDKAKEAEKEPQKVLARLQEESDRIVNEERARAHEHIANMSRDAWTEALTDIRKDNRFPELTYREGDTEHNEKVVRPTLQRAGQEYGKIVKTLAQNGLKSMPKEVAVALSKLTQLAHQASLLAVERANYMAENAKLKSLLSKQSNINRPGINTGNISGQSSNSGSQRGLNGTANLQSTARGVLNRVIASAK